MSIVVMQQLKELRERLEVLENRFNVVSNNRQISDAPEPVVITAQEEQKKPRGRPKASPDADERT